MSRLTRKLAVGAGAALLAFAQLQCAPPSGRAAVTLRLNRGEASPRDASVIIDETYIGPLYYVAARGVRLPVGVHRITVQKEGYFPWDRLVEADRQPVHLDVQLVPVPD